MNTLQKQEMEPSADAEGVTPEAVRDEVRHIIASRHFRSSKRCQQFLQYVVEQKLLGNEASIKERLIGIEVFGRDNNYATGDDPVVRVQAGEVRRRLELYRAESHQENGVSVDLPTGTYVPVFRIRESAVLAAPSSGNIAPLKDASPAAAPSQADIVEPEHVLHLAPIPANHLITPPQTSPGAATLFSRRSLAFGFLLLVLGGVVGYLFRAPFSPGSAVNRFWRPVLSNSKPIVISLGKPFVYTPSAHLFDEYAKTHPGAFANGIDRHNEKLPLDPNTTIPWSDLDPVSNSGPAVGGVRAALTLASFFGKSGKPFNVRFGDEGSFTELRDSPAVILGAMNNRWTTDIDSDFHFGIKDNNAYKYIAETGTNRTWKTEYSSRGARDYGLITREPTGATGQFFLKIAGLQDGGTEAACELLTNPDLLQSVVRTLPPAWESKNLQIIVATDMIGRKAGPPQVVAVYTW